MPNDEGVLKGFFSLFKKQSAKAIPKQSEKCVHFTDPLGNFELDIPKGWRFDRDVIVDSGQYSISFEAQDRRMRFVVSVDTKPPEPADFESYVRKECEGPASGILCGMSKKEFRGYLGYGRRFIFGKGNDESVREDRIFLTAGAVFTISRTRPIIHSAPEPDSKTKIIKKDAKEEVLDWMFASFIVKKGLSVPDIPEYR